MPPDLVRRRPARRVPGHGDLVGIGAVCGAHPRGRRRRRDLPIAGVPRAKITGGPGVLGLHPVIVGRAGHGRGVVVGSARRVGDLRDRVIRINPPYLVGCRAARWVPSHAHFVGIGAVACAHPCRTGAF